MLKHGKKRAHSLLHLATHVFNVPLMIHPEKLNAILSVLGPRLGIHPDELPGATLDLEPQDAEETPDTDAIAVIRVYGTLVKRSMPMDAMSGMTSYEELRADIEAALADEECKGILLDIDSPGGESAGMFELADYIYSVRGQKPMYAVSNDSMYSAAYAIGSAADKLYCTQVGGMGSIGVYMLHVDQSGYDKMLGVKYTYIKSGDRKTEGNPHEPLSDAALASAQAEVDRQRDMFVTLVARNRGLAANIVYDTQAACYNPAEASALGLCDQIGMLDDALDDMTEALGLEARSTAPRPKPKAAALTVEQIEPDALAAVSELVRFAGANLSTAVPMVKQYAGSGIELHVRTFTAKAQSSGRTISCCVAPYGQLSCDLGGFKEIYEAGCFAECLKTDDPLALFGHDPMFVLGCQSAGTARFIEKADGLYFEADAPDTQWASDLLVSMKRGDIKRSSAAFFILKPRWEYQGSQKVRVIEQAKLVEASVVAFAAYGTSTAAIVESAIASEQGIFAARLRLLAA